MPRPRTVVNESMIENHPELKIEGQGFYCTVCKSSFKYTRSSRVSDHVISKKHKQRLKGERCFNFHLTEFLVGNSISFRQLQNPIFRDFLESCIRGEYENTTLPTESALKQNNVMSVYESTKVKIFADLCEKPIWVSLCEKPDTGGRAALNILMGHLDEAAPSKAHLVACKAAEYTSADSVAAVIDSELRKLWDNKHNVNKENFLLLITTDSMKQVGEILKETYSSMLHLICLADLLNQLAEEVVKKHPTMYDLIENVKQVFCESESRIDLFENCLSHIPLPPEPDLNHWGAYLEAASYYYSYFDDIKSVIQQLDATEAEEISNAQKIFSNGTIKNDLNFVHGNFSRISLAIENMDRKDNTSRSLNDSLNIIFDLRNYLYRLSGDVAEAVQRKFQVSLEENPGFNILYQISSIIDSKEADVKPDNLKILQNYKSFKYAPVIAADAKQYSPQMKYIYRDRHRVASAEHFEALLIVQFYNINHTEQSPKV